MCGACKSYLKDEYVVLIYLHTQFAMLCYTNPPRQNIFFYPSSAAINSKQTNRADHTLIKYSSQISNRSALFKKLNIYGSRVTQQSMKKATKKESKRRERWNAGGIGAFLQLNNQPSLERISHSPFKIPWNGILGNVRQQHPHPRDVKTTRTPAELQSLLVKTQNAQLLLLNKLKLKFFS